MTAFEISENTFSKKSSPQCELSILHGVDSFAYMITDERQAVQFLKEYRLLTDWGGHAERAEELRGLIDGDTNLRATYRQLRLGLVGSLNTFIPNRLYNPREKETYLSQLAPLADELAFCSDDLQGLGVQNVYACPRVLLDLFREKFPDAHLLHSGSAFVMTYRALSATLPERQVFIHVWARHLQLVFFENQELRFINIFPYRNPKDFIYFVLLIFDQFSLDPVQVPSYLSGHILGDSELFHGLCRYIRKVEMLPAPGFVQVGPALRETPKHVYYDLYSLLKYGGISEVAHEDHRRKI